MGDYELKPRTEKHRPSVDIIADTRSNLLDLIKVSPRSKDKVKIFLSHLNDIEINLHIEQRPEVEIKCGNIELKSRDFVGDKEVVRHLEECEVERHIRRHGWVGVKEAATRYIRGFSFVKTKKDKYK